MIFALVFSLLAILFFIAVLTFLVLELRSVRQNYETGLEFVLEDRDKARKEVETLRAALFPQLARMAGAATQTPAAMRNPVPPVNPSLQQLFPPRVPWRIRFKQLSRQNNSKQMGRDRHAAAISEAKEAPHA
jgi:hypothetical protein